MAVVGCGRVEGVRLAFLLQAAPQWVFFAGRIWPQPQLAAYLRDQSDARERESSVYSTLLRAVPLFASLGRGKPSAEEDQLA